MSRCPLAELGAERLLTGELSAETTARLEQHLSEACETCTQVLADAGLDEESLLMLLVAADQPEPGAAQIDRVWERVEAQLDAAGADPSAASETRRGEAAPTNVIALRTRRRFLSVFTASAVAAAAAVILLALPEEGPRGDDGYDGIKGEATTPVASLGLSPAGPLVDGDTLRLTYQLDRDAFVAVMQAQLDDPPVVLFNDRLPAAPAGDGRFTVDGGQLGYRFENEAGRHLFVLLASDRALDRERCEAIFTAVATVPDRARHDFRFEGRGVAVHARLIEVAPRP